jgi:hypothetical protein
MQQQHILIVLNLPESGPAEWQGASLTTASGDPAPLDLTELAALVPDINAAAVVATTTHAAEVVALQADKNQALAALTTSKNAAFATLTAEKDAAFATLTAEKEAALAALTAEKNATISGLQAQLQAAQAAYTAIDTQRAAVVTEAVAAMALEDPESRQAALVDIVQRIALPFHEQQKTKARAKLLAEKEKLEEQLASLE